MLRSLRFAISFAFLVSNVAAGDWPQILGPYRSGRADNETLANDWSQDAPVPRWKVRVGAGFAGPAVVGDGVLIFHRQEDREILVCLNSERGAVRWTADWPANYRGGIDPDNGPRCVPLVHEDRVFVHGAAGDVHCVKFETGEKLWSQELSRDYRANEGYFGFGSTPIVIQGLLLVNVGGRDGAGIVALDAATGRAKWQTDDDQASYSSPIVWNSTQGPQVIFVTRLHAQGLLPGNGKETFRVPFGRRGATVNAATPLLIEPDHLFLTASYSIGARLLKLDSENPRLIWSGDMILSSQYPTPVLAGDHLYGVHGREDGPPGSLRCVEAMTGKIKWEERDFGMAHFVLADDKLIVLKTTGELLLVQPTPTQYRELGRHAVSSETTRALPALAAGHLYVRDVAGWLTAWKLP